MQRPLRRSLEISLLARRPLPPRPLTAVVAAAPVVGAATIGRVGVAEELVRGRELEVLVNGHEYRRLWPTRNGEGEKGLKVGMEPVRVV